MNAVETSATDFPDGRPEADQPKWRRDFPIDLQTDEYGARRDFTKFMVLTSLAFAIGQLWIGLQSLFRRPSHANRRRIAKLSDVPVGAACSFHYPTDRDQCLLIRTSETVLHAYSSECTHLMCPVRPDLDKNRLHCPCHEGSFDPETGRPTAGPPRRPLPRIRLEIDRGVVYAIGVELSVS